MKTLNHPRKASSYIVWGTVVLVLVQLCWLQMGAESATRRLGAILSTDGTDGGGIDMDQYCDRVANRASVEGGSVLLRFVGYTAGDPRDENLASFLYYRASYTLYPRRVYIAAADQVINGGRDILEVKFDPDNEWLREHHVRSVLTFLKDASGSVTVECKVIETGDEQPGEQTGGAGGK